MKKPESPFKTIMLVDDNEIDNFINQKMIEGTNFSNRVFTYSSGKSALEFLKNLEHNDLVKELVPDYIFLDINMPMMDGHQFLEEFEKLHDVVKAKCKIAVLTTSLNPMDKQKALNSPLVSNFINKPLTKESLESLHK